MNDYDLGRFFPEHDNDYPQALREIRAGEKLSHWIWYIFPQLRGLGKSNFSWKFGIIDAQEAKLYLSHPVLGNDLTEISEALLKLDCSDPVKVMGGIDALKLKSCMTLFAAISEEGSVFHKVLEKFFGGNKDEATLSLLKL